MRHGRAKAARKTLQYFSRTIGLRAPYWILLDATFVAALFQQKILPVKQRMDRILQTNSHPGSTAGIGTNRYCITRTAVDELKLILEGLQAKNHEKVDAFQAALDWIRQECMVLKREDDPKVNQEEVVEASKGPGPTQAQEDLLYHIEHDETPYIVASQDDDLLRGLRGRGTVPIVRLAHGSVLLLEQPSRQSQNQSKGAERQKWKHSLPEAERALVDLVRKEKRVTSTSGHQQSQSHGTAPSSSRQRIKKAKGPNPLSCKRKQPSSGGQTESASKKRRKRAANK